MKYNKSLFLFHRDLRANDNLGLIKATEESKEVCPLFIFDEKQVGEENSYRSENAIQFMVESLDDLEEELDNKLSYFHGKTLELLEKILKKEKIEAFYTNRDYTPFSIRRDRNIKNLCKELKVDYYQIDDALLNPPEKVVQKTGKTYGIFTPYYNQAKLYPIEKPKKCKKTNLKKISPEKNLPIKKNPQIMQKGGRKEGLKILAQIKNHKEYTKERDFPHLDATTKLSAHHKFGTLSIRESYHAVKENLGPAHPLLRQLYWRDFFTQVAFHNPHVFGHAYHIRFNNLKWRNSEKDFTLWCKGETGFPIVDAAMHQLNRTGWMHNRLRMIVASFLCKALLIDWRKGEKYFAQKLLDYDPCVNNGNWQWAASTGCDSQPYFRIFNPWLQQKRFDPECTFIKTEIPQLKKHEQKFLHNLHKEKTDYFPPICDHKERSEMAIKMFKVKA